jgi:hypothetical protein
LHSSRICRFSLSLEDRAFERDGCRFDKLVSDVRSFLSRNGRVGRLLASSPALLLEQIVCQGVIAGMAAWTGFFYSARLLDLVIATFLPAITPAIAVTVGLVLTGGLPTVRQWSMIAMGSVGALPLARCVIGSASISIDVGAHQTICPFVSDSYHLTK